MLNAFRPSGQGILSWDGHERSLIPKLKIAGPQLVFVGCGCTRWIVNGLSHTFSFSALYLDSSLAGQDLEVMKLRIRPYMPVVYGTYGKSPNEQALQILALFFPWVIDPEDASRAVPFVQDIFTMDMRDWQEALRSRIFQFGFPTKEVKRFAVNFCFVFCLPVISAA